MLKSHPFGRGGCAWALAQWSAAAERAAGLGVRGSARLQATDADDLLSRPNLECDGATAVADDGVGAVVQRPERRTQTSRAERSWAGSWLGRLELELCLGKEKTAASSVF
jgi:hypothetical protein